VARDRNLRISLELMLTPHLKGLIPSLHHQATMLRTAAQWFDQQKLRVHLSQTFPLTEAAAAHQALETGHTTGKMVLLTA
ncbi:MAG: zinc-binding dehydrogenase, partial [Microcystaceae cyanobacterium]